MVFSSVTFLLFFLPILLIIYFLVKDLKMKNYILLLFSLIFYAWGEPVYIIIMILSIIVTYFSALLINRCNKNKKLIFIISIILLLSSLIFFKYYNFIVMNINSLFKLNIVMNNLALPIGISFYTFQSISYICDVYSKKVNVQKNIFSLALYISLFPQLIAGPIVRYETIEKEIKNRKHTLDNTVKGLKRFIIGLSKKVIIANSMAIIADTIYDSYTNAGTILLYLGAICYTLQIYYDFSGYSDMAIGLGKVFGFTFLENFNYPYISRTITEFWRRWHISLSSWFKDYVYIPLGGSRVRTIKHIRNILIVWLLTGLWHGASWNFITWGIYYGVLLLLEKFVFKKLIDKMPKLVSHIVTLFLIVFGWVIFRITDLNTLITTIKYMFIYKESNMLDFILHNSKLIIDLYLIIPAIILCYPFKIKINKKNYFIVNLIIDIMYIILLLINISMIVSNTYNPFIYFRF